MNLEDHIIHILTLIEPLHITHQIKLSHCRKYYDLLRKLIFKYFNETECHFPFVPFGTVRVLDDHLLKNVVGHLRSPISLVSLLCPQSIDYFSTLFMHQFISPYTVISKQTDMVNGTSIHILLSWSGRWQQLEHDQDHNFHNPSYHFCFCPPSIVYRRLQMINISGIPYLRPDEIKTPLVAIKVARGKIFLLTDSVSFKTDSSITNCSSAISTEDCYRRNAC